MILAASAEYFSKISKHIQDIDVKEAEIIHRHTLGVGPESERQIAIMANKIQQKAISRTLVIVLAIVRNIVPQELYYQIYNKLPEEYKIKISERETKLLNDGTIKPK